MDGSSALLLNNVILSYDKVTDLYDISYAMMETAVGTALTSRYINTGFGFNKTDPTKSSQYGSEFVMSPGVFISTSIAQVYPLTKDTFTINLHSQINATNLTNCYIFGSIYLVLRDDNKTTVEPVIAVGNTGSGSEAPLPIVMTRDVDANTVYNSLLGGGWYTATPQYNIWGSHLVSYVKLHDFILDIDYFNTTSNFQMNVINVDQRRLRSWAAYAEENMSINFTAVIANYKNATKTGITAYNSQIKQLVSKWINLPEWQPDFLTYWTYITPPMPDRLKQYIAQEFGIIVP